MDKTDKEIILDIVTLAFAENPRIHAMIKKGRTEERIRYMADYAYHLIKKFNGVYLSKDKTTVLFLYKKSDYRLSFVDYIRYIIMFLKHIRITQFIPTQKRERYIESLRPQIPDYIYVWILGSVPNNKSLKGLADIRDHLFGMSERLNMPILIETTVDKVLKLYKYVGFEIYHEWNDKSADLNVRFLKRGDIGSYK